MEKEIINNLNNNMNQMVSISKYILKKSNVDVTSFQFCLLKYLALQGDLNVGMLVKYFECDQGNLSSTIKRMEKKGWLERKRSPEDERVVIVSISQQGLEIIKKVDLELNDFVEKMNAYMSYDEMAYAASQLSRLFEVCTKVIKEEKDV